jgi:hypothetical protein
MSLYVKVWRATEGNKTLARQLVKATKDRDKFTSAFFKKTIKPIIERAQANIVTAIQGMEGSYWQLTNLRLINRSLT